MIKQKTLSSAHGAFGASDPIRAGGPPRAHRLPGDIVADVPPGVHSDSISQTVAPFVGNHHLATGQTISVSMNAPNPNLSFKEWAMRGMLGAVGHMFAWPFRLVGGVIEKIAHAIVGLLKWAAIILLFPTLIMMGMKLQHQMSTQPTIESGTAAIMHSGRHVANGIGHGLSDDLPPEDRPAPNHAAKNDR